MSSETASTPLPVRAWPVVAALLSVTLALLGLNVLVKVLAGPDRDIEPWLRAFNVNSELNVPTMWNAALLIGVAALCAFVAALAPPGRLGWLAAAAVSSAMALDEVLRWHEGLRVAGSRLNALLPFSLPTYNWVLPGLLIAAAIAAAAVFWTRRLPADVRRRLLLGVSVYFGGALGAEAVSGWVEDRYGAARAYTLVTALEEGMDMAGCVDHDRRVRPTAATVGNRGRARAASSRSGTRAAK